ncbi:jg8842 [Pararge aegeria aegeria]|uniref:Jg8842 protein n=1 Tax=Pararge aegeria aegeria TaxID=348720 RepID=A0A8S4SCY6_9NEOP|nr:jg8842 [Pararge aegeria aegeria]
MRNATRMSLVRAQRLSSQGSQTPHIHQKRSKIYFEKSIQHPNYLMCAAYFYSPNLSATINKRRPEHILYDPNDRITTVNAPYQDTKSAKHLRYRRPDLSHQSSPELKTSHEAPSDDPFASSS